MFELNRFRKVGGWIAGQIAYANAAVQVFANIVTYPPTTVRSGHAGREHGGTAAAVDVVAPGAHVGTRPAALIDHAPELEPF